MSSEAQLWMAAALAFVVCVIVSWHYGYVRGHEDGALWERMRRNERERELERRQRNQL